MFRYIITEQQHTASPQNIDPPKTIFCCEKIFFEKLVTFCRPKRLTDENKRKEIINGTGYER